MEPLFKINRFSFIFCCAILCCNAIFSILACGEDVPPPTTRLQIINATCVKSISLAVNGVVDYPEFEQGLYTADAPIPTLSAYYVAKDNKTSTEAKSELIKYEPNAVQSLVILGDFSNNAPAGWLLQPGSAPLPLDKKVPPNVLFRKFSHDVGNSSGTVRLKVLNGMPGRLLRFVGASGQVEVLPGFDVDMKGEPPIFQYTATIDGKEIPVLMKQEDVVRNAMVIFYLKDGEPAFMRAFEN